jgi:hypothetical protein
MIDPKVLGLTIKLPPERKEVAATPAAVEKPSTVATIDATPARRAPGMRRTAAQFAVQKSVEQPVKEAVEPTVEPIAASEIVTVDAKSAPAQSNVIWEPMTEIPATILSHENAHLNDAGDKLLIDVCLTCRSTEKAHYCTDLKKGRRLLWAKAQGLNSSLWNVLKESARVGKIVREARDKANQVPDPYALFPAELKALERFGLYRLLWNDKTKKNDKPPYNARTHMKGNPKDESQRSTYAIVSKVLATDTRYQGAGFGIQYSDGFTCTDFDHCVDAAGVIEPRIKKILDETNSYAEFSPSGDGIHLWTKGWQFPWDGTNEGQQGTKVGNAEMYSGKHYMTVTGKHVPSTPLTIESRDMSALYARVCAREFVIAKQAAPAQVPTPTALAVPVAQQERRRVVNDGTSQVTTTMLELFMNGEIDTSEGFTVRDEHGNYIQPPYDSQNAADLALVTLLMFKHDGDESLVDDDFRHSALTRDKWEGRADYRELTFKKARETYKKHKLEKATATAGAMIADVSTEGEESDYDEDLDDVQEPLPDFPKMTGSLAELCHAISPDIPFEYKYAVALAYFGLFRSGIDFLATEPHLQTRFYMSLIGLPWRGKTAALKEIRKVMLLLYRSPDFGRMVSVDSGQALVEQLWKLQRERVFPVATPSTEADVALSKEKTPRVAMMIDPDEMSDLFEKGKVTANSSKSIFSEFLKLYDGNETENTTKKDGKRFIPNGHLAFVAGATVQGYPMLWTCTGASASGLISRWTPIGTNAGRVPVEQRQTDGEKLAAATQRITAQLNHPGRMIRLTPDAARMLREWADLAPTGEGAQAAQARVTDMVKKLLIVLAATNDTDEIGTDMVGLGIQFGDYITTLRERYNPQDSWTWAQAFENDIVAALKKKKVMSNRELMQAIHPDRKPGGYGSYKVAFKNLLDVGRAKQVIVPGTNRKAWRLSGG